MADNSFLTEASGAQSGQCPAVFHKHSPSGAAPGTATTQTRNAECGMATVEVTHSFASFGVFGGHLIFSREGTPPGRASYARP